MRFNKLLGQHNPEQSQEQNALRSRHAYKMPVVFSFLITKLNAPWNYQYPWKNICQMDSPLDWPIPPQGWKADHKQGSIITHHKSFPTCAVFLGLEYLYQHIDPINSRYSWIGKKFKPVPNGSAHKLGFLRMFLMIPVDRSHHLTHHLQRLSL